jgi:carbonic anhydrase
MRDLLKGVEKFQSEIYCAKKSLFQSLSKEGQHPHVLFIACSDSRVDPELLTQSEPGELFVLRNAGNIVPPFTGNTCGEAATIEYAINVLEIQHIVVCGHSQCGAISHLIDHHEHPFDEHLPMVSKWLRYADATRTITEAHWHEHSEETRYEFAIETNIKVQLNNLMTHPSVAQALSLKKLTINGWLYHVDSGQLHVYDKGRDQFVLPDAKTPPLTKHSTKQSTKPSSIKKSVKKSARS